MDNIAGIDSWIMNEPSYVAPIKKDGVISFFDDGDYFEIRCQALYIDDDIVDILDEGYESLPKSIWKYFETI